jgi:hypothetical protein
VRAIAGFAVLLVLVATACAHRAPDPEPVARFESRFGFALAIPADWVALDPSKDPGKLEQIRADLSGSGVDPALLDAALEKVKSGRVEFLFRQPFQRFTQNISISARTGMVPASDEAVARMCAQGPKALREAYKREIAEPICRLGSVDGQPALYLELEGPIPGTHNLQYQVQRAPGSVVMVTASVMSENLEALRPEFESIVQSMEFE